MINFNYYGVNPLLKFYGIYKNKNKNSHFFFYNSIIRGVEI